MQRQQRMRKGRSSLDIETGNAAVCSDGDIGRRKSKEEMHRTGVSGHHNRYSDQQHSAIPESSFQSDG